METREEMIKKIEAKRTAVEKLASKPKNIENMVTMYRNAIADHEAKIAALEERIEKYEVSGAASSDLATVRQGELEHMEQILASYDAAEAERVTLSAYLLEKIQSDNWMPGDDPELKNAWKRDPEYVSASNRKQFLDAQVESALPDMKKVYISRGEVSAYHRKADG